MRLASQLRSNPTLIITDGRLAGFPIYQVWANLGGSLGWQQSLYYYPPAGFPHYPFGFDVFPDDHT